MKKKLTLLVASASVLFASPNIEQIKNDVSVLEKKSDINKNINRSMANSSEDILYVDNNSTEINLGIPKNVEEPIIKEPVSKELLYFNLLQQMQSSRDAIALTPAKPVKNDTFSLTKKEELKNNNSSVSKNETTTNEKVMSFRGICQFDNTYNISEPMTVNVPCRFDNKIMVLNLTLKPNNSGYELQAVPNFLLHDELNNSTYSKRIFIDPTISNIKNASGNSNNIATYFDSRKIEKILGITAKELSTSLADGTQQTFEDYRSYKTKESVSYDANGNVIVTSDTQKPDLATNLAYSVVEGVFRVVEKGVEMANVESLPSLYQIVKNSIINVELYSKVESLK